MTVIRLDFIHRLSYFRFCNVLHIWTIRAIPMYGVPLFGGMEWWNGTVEWNSGMVEYWNGGMTTPTSGTTITYFKQLLLSACNRTKDNSK